MKKVVIGIGVLFLLAAGLLVLFQPSFLKEAVVQLALKQSNRKQPYQVSLEGVGGNFFGVVVLRDVRIRVPTQEAPLIYAPRVRVGLNWMAMLKKRVVIRSLWIENPAVTMTLDKNNQLVLPKNEAPSPETSTAWAIYLRRCVVEGGALRLHRGADPILEMTDVDFHARLTPKRFVMKSASLRLGDGRLRAEGIFEKEPVPHLSAEVKTQAFPFHQLAKAFSSLPESMQLTHSGQWKVEMSSMTRWTMRSTGEMDKAPLEVDLSRHDHIYEARLSWRQVPLSKLGLRASVENFATVKAHLQARQEAFQRPTGEMWITLSTAVTAGTTPWGQGTFTLRDGQGPILVRAQWGDAIAIVQGSLRTDGPMDVTWILNVPRLETVRTLLSQAPPLTGSMTANGAFKTDQNKNWRSTARGEAKDVHWDLRRVKKMEFEVVASKFGKNNLRLTFENISQGSEDHPFDLEAATVELRDRLTTPYHAVISARFNNKATLGTTLKIRKETRLWETEFQQLEIKLPQDKAVWRLPSPAYLRISPTLTQLQSFALVNGDQKLAVSGELSRKGFMDVWVDIPKLDLSQMAVWVPQLQVDEGRFQLNVHVRGMKPSWVVSGYTNSSIHEIRSKKMGFPISRY